MTYNFINWARNPDIQLYEGVKGSLVLNPLPYARSDLAPAVSEATINYHWNKLARAYVDRYNAGEGDSEFNTAGAFLHNILFAQYQAHTSSNKPTGTILAFITENFGGFEAFKSEFLKEAMSIQGSGWVYLARNGTIKTIANHSVRKDIVILVDWWEHAWALDYQQDKKKYLANQWSIIDWRIVTARL
jgi:Fe-Mn family superoxide dismutase